MSTIHDHSINYIEIKCGMGEILLHTNLVNEEHPEEKIIKFKGVIGHQFIHVLEGNIIFDILKENPEDFYKDHKSELLEYHSYGLRLNCENTEYFTNSLNLNGVSIYRIHSSYGLSGWIIAKEMIIKKKFV